MTDDTPLVIAVAPNGARLTKTDHSAVPLTTDEIARDAAACAEAGAAMIHLHVRDARGRHLLDADAYREAAAAIAREAGPDMIVQITTEAAGRYAPEQQMAVVRDAKPEAASIALRELCPDGAAEAGFADFVDWMAQESVWPQFILYNADDIARFADLRQRGLIPGRLPFVLLVLGRRERPARPADLLGLVRDIPEAAAWAVCAFGRGEAACTLTAAALGGHSRVGFENNIYLADGRPAPSNAALVENMRKGAGLIGRPVATGQAARDRLRDAAFA